MSMDMPAASTAAAEAVAAGVQSARWAWVDVVLTVLFAGSAVLAVSFLAVIKGLA
jgi:hypothetical protein